MSRTKRLVVAAVIAVVGVLAIGAWSFVQTIQFAERCVGSNGAPANDQPGCGKP